MKWIRNNGPVKGKDTGTLVNGDDPSFSFGFVNQRFLARGGNIS